MRATFGGRTVRRERPARLLELPCTRGSTRTHLSWEGSGAPAGLGQGLASDGGVLGRLCLSAATEPHRSLQGSGPTELPQRKSHLVTKKALWFTTPLETVTNPFPVSLSLVFCGRSSTSHSLLSGDFASWAVPQELMTRAQTNPSQACYNKLHTDITWDYTSKTHIIVFAPLPSSLGTNSCFHSTPDSTPSVLPDQAKGLPNSTVLCKTSSSTSKIRRMALP